MHMSRRGQIAPIFMIVATMVMVAILFAINVVGFQSTAGAAMGGALRSGALAGLQQFDPVKSACGRYAMRLSATTSVDCEGTTVASVSSPAGTTATSVIRQYVTDALVGVGASGDYQSLFIGTIATIIADTAGTAGATKDGLDVEIINPAYSAGQTNERMLNTALDTARPNCAGSGIYPAGVLSSIDGACYTSATVVVRLTLKLYQTGSATGQTITRAFSASAGTNLE
jgi:hypothetical protein